MPFPIENLEKILLLKSRFFETVNMICKNIFSGIFGCAKLSEKKFLIKNEHFKV
jgi:hypothetical protein